MTNPLTTRNAQNFSLLLVRLALGLYFAIAGWNKIRGGVSQFVSSQAGNVPDFLPDYLGRTYLFLLPYVELATGLALALGLFARVAAFLQLLMLISFIIAVTGIRTQQTPFHANVIYATVAFLLLAHGPGSLTVDRLFKGGGGGKKSAE